LLSAGLWLIFECPDPDEEPDAVDAILTMHDQSIVLERLTKLVVSSGLHGADASAAAHVRAISLEPKIRTNRIGEYHDGMWDEPVTPTNSSDHCECCSSVESVAIGS
jgi:hypothetical protein